MQEFGSVWTEQKLIAVEEYLKAYCKIMKNQKFKTCYIDAFSGSGHVTIKGGKKLDGSAVRALKFPFDRYYFYELDNVNFTELQSIVNLSGKKGMVDLRNGDCNSSLIDINKNDWIGAGWRGVAFLDPYAMQLPWSTLESISQTKIFDVWYFFPFYAVNRNLYKNKYDMPETTKNKITKILGTSEWEDALYNEVPQMSLFGIDYEKADTVAFKSYVLERLKTIFPTVSDDAVLFKNEKNAPIFLLCFAGSNPSPKASAVSLRVANYILKHI